MIHESLRLLLFYSICCVCSVQRFSYNIQYLLHDAVDDTLSDDESLDLGGTLIDLEDL